MQFNTEKPEEAMFSCERNKPFHPDPKSGEGMTASKLERKHLGVIHDSKFKVQKSYSRGYLKRTERNWFVKIIFKINIKRQDGPEM